MTDTKSLKVGELLVEHLGLAVAGALGLVTVLHVWAFVGYDRTSALAALGVVDQPQLLLASVVIVAITILPIFLLQTQTWFPLLRMRSDKPLSLRVGAYVAVVTAVIAGVMSLSAFLLAILVAVYVTVGLRRRRARKEGRLTADGKIQVSRDNYEWSQAMLATSIGGLLLAQLTQSWVPTEKLTISGSEDPVVVWVLGADDDQLLVKPREGRVYWVPREDVSDREICWTSGSWLWRPTTDWIDRPKDTPRC